MIWLLIAAWLILSVPVAVVVGRAIRGADEREVLGADADVQRALGRAVERWAGEEQP